VTEKRFSVVAYAVVANERGQLLLTRRRQSDEWVLPDGSVEDEEAPWEAAVREVKEETGIEITLRRLVGIYAKRREQDIVFVFAAAAVGGELRASDERDRERILDTLAPHAAPALSVQPSQDDEPPAGTR
jgi:ADP-ribose pyrophosphatase YjhB (NUDIX family)